MFFSEKSTGLAELIRAFFQKKTFKDGCKISDHTLRFNVDEALALNSLINAVDEYKKNTNNLFVRDASIQRFEYTYELAHKMIKRYLEISEPNAEAIDLMSFPDLIRTAAERGLILHSWDQWKLYRDSEVITMDVVEGKICHLEQNRR